MLQEIINLRKKIINSLKKCIKTCERALPYRSLIDSIRSKNLNSDIGIIVEYKRASPRGIIRLDIKPDDYVSRYSSIACGFSVLVEPYWFLGSLEFIPLIKECTNLPVLFKDFVIDLWQIELAWSLGADAILLICEILTDRDIERFIEYSLKLGLEVLIESNNSQQLLQIYQSYKNSKVMLGLNSRNLKTLTVNFEEALANLVKIRQYIDDSTVIVLESGVASFRDIERARSHGANAVLVGTFMMKNF